MGESDGNGRGWEEGIWRNENPIFGPMWFQAIGVFRDGVRAAVFLVAVGGLWIVSPFKPCGPVLSRAIWGTTWEVNTWGANLAGGPEV